MDLGAGTRGPGEQTTEIRHMRRCTGPTCWDATRASLLLPLVLWCGTALSAEPRQDVTWPGMTPAGAVLLPNGWTLSPAGQQTRLGDFPVLIAAHPTEPILAVLHAGYGEHQVMTLDARTGKPIGSVV